MLLRTKALFALLLLAALAYGCGAVAPQIPAAPTPAAAPLAPSNPTASPLPLAEALVKATAVSKAGHVERDVRYCTAGNIPLLMDVYYPRQTGLKPSPAIVYVHGGGWTSGDKSEAEVASFANLMSTNGYLLVSINYRLAPDYLFPAQIEDVKCAVRYLRSHASDYYIDPGRMGAWGPSAGGHLVSLLALAGPAEGFDGGEYQGQSSAVQAVVDMFGPADLTVQDMDPVHVETVKTAFGTADNAKRGSPVLYVAKDAPPFLIIQGKKDDLVPPSQSQVLYDKLKAAGADATLIMVDNAGHGLVSVGGPLNPPLEDVMQSIVDFFNRTLKQ